MDLTLSSSIFQAFMIATREYILFPFIILGIVFVDRRLFLRAALILLSSFIVNIYLKDLFQVPLKAHIQKDWWAFPSGHAQFAATFYGYLIYKYRNPLLRILGLILIIGIGCSVVYLGYHDWIDVLGAWVAAALWIILFDYLERSALFRDRLYLLSLIIFIASYFILRHVSKTPGNESMLLGAQLGLTVGLFIELLLSQTPTKKLLPIFELLIIVVGALLFYLIFTQIPSIRHLIGKSASIFGLYLMVVSWAVSGPKLLMTTKQ